MIEMLTNFGLLLKPEKKEKRQRAGHFVGVTEDSTTFLRLPELITPSIIPLLQPAGA